MKTGYGVLPALFQPVLFLGVHWLQATLELAVCLFLGLFVSWYFIFVVVVIHIITIFVYKTNQFAFSVILQALKYPATPYKEVKND